MHISKFSIEGTYFSSYLQCKIIFHILRHFFPIFEIYIRFYISNMNLVQNYNKINFWPYFYQKQPNFRISVEQVPLQNILKYAFSGSIYPKNSPPTRILVGTPNQTYFRFCSSVSRLFSISFSIIFSIIFFSCESHPWALKPMRPRPKARLIQCLPISNAAWWNILNLSQPNLLYEQMNHPVQYR